VADLWHGWFLLILPAGKVCGSFQQTIQPVSAVCKRKNHFCELFCIEEQEETKNRLNCSKNPAFLNLAGSTKRERNREK